jgi:hypothetical protein
MSIESRAFGPPLLVVAAARHAFREHSRTAAEPVSLVFDSRRDDTPIDCAPRLMMFSGDTFDLILTVGTTSRGKSLGGIVISAERVALGIRRPLRATIALPTDEAGILVGTVLPSGTARVVVHKPTGETHQSNWLTL